MRESTISVFGIFESVAHADLPLSEWKSYVRKTASNANAR